MEKWETCVAYNVKKIGLSGKDYQMGSCDHVSLTARAGETQLHTRRSRKGNHNMYSITHWPVILELVFNVMAV